MVANSYGPPSSFVVVVKSAKIKSTPSPLSLGLNFSNIGGDADFCRYLLRICP